jgi:putative hydrolase of the HAD superfamily
MIKPSAVIFDLGKVLVDFDYGIAARKLARTGKDPAEVHRFIAESPLLFRYETGLLSRQDFYDAICADTGYGGHIDEFCGFFADIFSPIQPMIDLHADLRTRGVPTYIFSNTNDLAIDHIRRNFPFFNTFDGYILSYEVGAMKPDEKIYIAAEKLSGKHSSEILYLDDRQENIEAGARRGWQTILQVSPAATVSQVRNLGLLS